MWLWMKSWENGNKNLRQPDAPLALSGVGGLYIWLPHFSFLSPRGEKVSPIAHNRKIRLSKQKSHLVRVCATHKREPQAKNIFS